VQFLGTRAFATVGDSPLDKKVEMANTEKVSGLVRQPIAAV
jgi:hypothetical protein